MTTNSLQSNPSLLIFHFEKIQISCSFFLGLEQLSGFSSLLLLFLVGELKLLLLATRGSLQLQLLVGLLEGREVGIGLVGGLLRFQGPGWHLEINRLRRLYLWLFRSEPSWSLSFCDKFRLLLDAILELFLLQLLGCLLKGREIKAASLISVHKDDFLDRDAANDWTSLNLLAEDHLLFPSLLSVHQRSEFKSSNLNNFRLVLFCFLFGFLNKQRFTSSSCLLMVLSVRLTKSVSCSAAFQSFLKRSLILDYSTIQLVRIFFSSFFSMTILDVSISFSSSLLPCTFFTVLTVVYFSLLSKIEWY